MEGGGRYEDVLIFQARALGIPQPIEEYVFALPRKWRFDLAWPEVKVAVEVEGGTWLPGGSRHTRAMGFERDSEKYGEAVVLGWGVLRVTGAMVNDGRAIALVERAIKARL